MISTVSKIDLAHTNIKPIQVHKITPKVQLPLPIDSSGLDFSQIPKKVNNGKYQILKKIGSGSFGEIYSGLNVLTNEIVAVKFESINCKHPQLVWESKIYRILSGGVGIPRLRWFGTEYGYNILILERLGNNLEDLFTYCNRKFSLKTVLMIADQTLRHIEYLHNRHHVHRDIKPSNFLVGLKEKKNQLYLIDFGLSKTFRNPKSHKHIRLRNHKHLTGTARYVSVNTHLGFEQSRRDDIEGLGYVLIYLYTGSLPWQGLNAETKKMKYQIIAESKISTSIESLCSNCPEEFTTYLRYVRGLEFEERPNYSYLRSLFRQLLIKERFAFDYVFDWDIKHSLECLPPERLISPFVSPFTSPLNSPFSSPLNSPTPFERQNRNKRKKSVERIEEQNPKIDTSGQVSLSLHVSNRRVFHQNNNVIHNYNYNNNNINIINNNNNNNNNNNSNNNMRQTKKEEPMLQFFQNSSVFFSGLLFSE